LRRNLASSINDLPSLNVEQFGHHRRQIVMVERLGNRRHAPVTERGNGRGNAVSREANSSAAKTTEPSRSRSAPATGRMSDPLENYDGFLPITQSHPLSCSSRLNI